MNLYECRLEVRTRTIVNLIGYRYRNFLFGNLYENLKKYRKPKKILSCANTLHT